MSTISPESCTENVLGRTPNLKKLGIRGKLVTLVEVKEGTSLFDNLAKLDGVKTMKLLNDTFPLPPLTGKLPGLPQGCKFPPNLKKLTLSDTLVDWEHMGTLGTLQNLEVLKLKDHAFTGRLWEPLDGGFRLLNFLHIGRTDLVEWKASAHHFPRLQRLVIRHCEKLKEIPSSLGNISTLQTMELYWPTNYTAESARKIKERRQQMQQKHSLINIGFKLTVYPPRSSRRTVVGFEDEAMEIMERLVGDREQLDVISIVGMAGIGKTTLALKVYNHGMIASHFYIRAWISVSQANRKRDLLLGILSSIYIDQSDGNILRMSDEKLSEELYKHLKGHRYLIVMDDVWNTKAWDDLKTFFPNDSNGSRIMLTSRFINVSLDVKPDSHPYKSRFLSKEESWDLLQEKIFQREICPPKLMEVGKKIAEKCQGLLLAVVVIGGFLAKMEKNEYSWKQVAESMNSYIGMDPFENMVALELSYNHLPNHLKPLFLYLGAFPDDYEIPVFKLIWLWIAEGFVTKNGDKSLEETAMDNLTDLIGRSLILSSKRSSNGEVKSCRMHDLLRDLCLRKAEEENFMQIIDENHQISSKFHSFTRSSSSPIANNLRALCIRSSFLPNFPFESFPKVYSIFCFNGGWSRSMSIISQNFKLLRVLDFLPVVFDSYPNEIEQLVHLRYLGLRARFNVLPASIVNIHNLETLIINGLGGSITVYADINRMMKLRHLYIHPGVSLASEDSLLSSHLQTISTSYFDRCNFSSLESIPNLRKLRCIIYDYEFNPSFRGLVPRLETLNMSYSGARRDIYLSHLPVNLKKLTLSKFRFNWKEIQEIARLPNLEVLKLLDNAFDGDWLEDTSCTESNLQLFPKLQFLKFESLNIGRWEVSKDYFPSLQRLVLNKCSYLQEIPSYIGYIRTLETIELTWSSNTAVYSARKIEEEQQNIGNDYLKILIQPPIFSSDLEHSFE